MPQDQNQHEETAALSPWRAAVLFALAAAAAGVLGFLCWDLLFRKLTSPHAPPGARAWIAIPYTFQNIGRMLSGSWEFPTRSAIGLGVSGAEVAGLFGLGYGLLSFIRPWRRCVPLAAERAALALPVAGVPVSLAVLGLGLAGFANAAAYGALLAVVFLAGLPGWIKLARDIRSSAGFQPARDAGWKPALLKIIVGFLLVLTLVYALSPATQSDELRYHLAAPATWLRDGRIHYLHYQAFSNFPMLGEMLFMPALALGGEEAAKPIHLAFLLACMGLIGIIGLRIAFRSGVPALAGYSFRLKAGHPNKSAISFALLPCVLILAGWGWIDLFVVAYFLAFVYLTGRALVHPRRASASLIGLIAGGGISVKYTMLALLGVLGAIWSIFLVLVRRNRNRSIFTLVLAVALFTLLFGGTWYAKNFAWTRNPFYPGATSIFGEGEWTKANDIFFRKKAETNAGMRLDWPQGAPGKIVEFIISPVTATLFPDRFEKNPLGPLPLLAVLAALGGLVARQRSKFKIQLITGESTVAPPMNAAQPQMNVAQPQINVAQPNVAQPNMAQPQMNVAHPQMNVAQPQMNVAHPQMNVAQPQMNAAQPQMNVAQPPSAVHLFSIFMLISLLYSWAQWFLTYQSNRFLMPAAALALVFGGAALAGDPGGQRTLPSPVRIWRATFRFLFFLGAVYSFLLVAIVMLNPPNLDAIAVGLGLKDRNIYLAENLNYWRPAQWLAQRARPGEKALLVGEHRTMHFALPVVASDWYDTPQPIPWLRQTKTNDEMLDQLLKNSVRFIFFNMAELRDQYHMFFLPRFTPEERKRFEDLGLLTGNNPRLKQIYPTTEKDGVLIFEIQKTE